MPTEEERNTPVSETPIQDAFRKIHTGLSSSTGINQSTPSVHIRETLAKLRAEEKEQERKRLEDMINEKFKQGPVIESVTKVYFQWGFRRFGIRVWRVEAELKDEYMNADILRLISSRSKAIGSDDVLDTKPPIVQLVTEIASLPRVSTVEVVDENSNGVTTYNLHSMQDVLANRPE